MRLLTAMLSTAVDNGLIRRMIVWTIGIIVLLIGIVLAVLGMVGHAVAARRSSLGLHTRPGHE